MSTPLKLVAFSKEQPARLLTIYLINQGINVEYQHSGNDYAHSVMLLELSDQIQAKKIAEEFVLNPNDVKYQTAAWQSGETVNLTPVKSFSAAKALYDLKQAPFTSSILAICLVIYLLAMIGISGPYFWLKIQPIAILIDSGQWWRLLGPALIHFSVLHIAFNMLWWWSLGKQIETTFGINSLLMLFVFSAIVSNASQLLVSGPNFGGLSGVVYALVGCVWWLGWLKPSWGLSLPKPIIGFLLVWLVVGYLDILPVNMANTAHTVGLICGCVFAWFLVTRAKSVSTQ
ncbi:rhomboid family intramembrane serine protease GlpG [Paraglaciecola psychrophila]|uniref:Rhomboid-like protein n=1 Tax=Paraglaciecola psychrophila 170 TaxID=1129794 RepID=K6ZUS4_9ALTE|nr:rhomboid family intramembrane serine protease GlpG [Paraglaciecola psychrophila]AGH42210.1 rhomboid-like protein [Paraglaciecola psychrophila 170]GAC39636.1 GlpG protein [Paraglaciecola psychrophila 170]